MKLTFLRRSSAAALAMALLGSAAACSSAKVDEGPPPEKLPAASEFRAGTCRSAADPMLALAKLTRGRWSAKALGDKDRKALTAHQDDLVKLQKAADKEVAPKLQALITATGFVRLRAATGSYDAKVLRDMDSARKDLQKACVK